MIPPLDEQTRLLARLSAAITAADEPTTRRVIEEAAASANAEAVEEVILQSYLICRISPRPQCGSHVASGIGITGTCR